MQLFEGTSNRVVGLTLSMVLISFAGVADCAQPAACIVADDGTGTAVVPPSGCTYQSPQEVYQIIDGLPPGTTIELNPIQRDFLCLTNDCGQPGGTLGGEIEDFDLTILFRATGTGELAGFDRILAVPAVAQTHSGPRTPGDPVQSFDTEWFQLAGSLPPGDPDFLVLQVVQGTGFGLPSPGHTVLTSRSDGTFRVDSFFDVTYQISFQGSPGGALDGLSGVTTGSLRIESVGHREPCIVSDDGSGTAELPPPGCEYVSPGETQEIIDGLPPGTTIELSPRFRSFFCPPIGECGAPGGTLGGEVEQFNGELVLQLEGTGTLTDFRRTIRLPLSSETHSGPRTPGDPVQGFPADFYLLSADIAGDPDFASLLITAGTGNGLPSPGYTSLTNLPNGTFQVDSFFDITYEIDFVGAPGGILEGLSGSTTGRTTINAHQGRVDDVEPDDGLGTVTMPPEGSAYESPNNPFMIIDGLPPGTTIEAEPKHWLFFCQTIPCGQPGGSLGGEVELYHSTLALEMTGDGSLAGFNRSIVVPLTLETHSGPRLPVLLVANDRGATGLPGQIFDTEMYSLQGSLFGDPDFSELTITAGAAHMLPSPGHTTLIDHGDGTFTVDSFFDINYRIDFVGAPGGSLDGMSGATEGLVRLTGFSEPLVPARNVTIRLAEGTGPMDFSFDGDFGSFALNRDIGSPLPGGRSFFNLPPSIYTVHQALPADWLIVTITCDDPDTTTVVDPSAGEAHINVSLGESITCTFKNVLIADFVFADNFESGGATMWSTVVGEAH